MPAMFENPSEWPLDGSVEAFLGWCGMTWMTCAAGQHVSPRISLCRLFFSSSYTVCVCVHVRACVRDESEGSFCHCPAERWWKTQAKIPTFIKVGPEMTRSAAAAVDATHAARSCCAADPDKGAANAALQLNVQPFSYLLFKHHPLSQLTMFLSFTHLTFESIIFNWTG